jgi:hypothetical protein
MLMRHGWIARHTLGVIVVLVALIASAVIFLLLSSGNSEPSTQAMAAQFGFALGTKGLAFG